MKNFFNTLIFTLTFSVLQIHAEPRAETHAKSYAEAQLEPQASTQSQESITVTFMPPKGWKSAESNQLSSRVKTMVVGTSAKGYPPSINLATENYSGTLKEYLKIIKSINDSKGTLWKNLGNISTDAGIGNLSQVESKTQWGDIRMMHVVLLKDGVIYILTATALRDEFSTVYKDFFKAFRSLKIS